jgi:hypothetical protein
VTKPINAQIAEALGWRTWQDPRPGHDGWFQECDAERRGYIEVVPLIDYIRILRDDVRVFRADQHPKTRWS